MKAWHVYYGDDPYEESLLVFAASRNRARVLALRKGPWMWEDYEHVRARRAPTWDKYAAQEMIAETNDDLPEGAEPFYYDEEEISE